MCAYIYADSKRHVSVHSENKVIQYMWIVKAFTNFDTNDKLMWNLSIKI